MDCKRAESSSEDVPEVNEYNESLLKSKIFCPSCGERDLQMLEGCMTCISCGHSKCA